MRNQIGPLGGRLTTRHTIHGYEEIVYDLNESHVISLVQRNPIAWLTYCLWRGQLYNELTDMGFAFDLDIYPSIDHFTFISEDGFVLNGIRSGSRIIPELRTYTILHFYDEGESVQFAFLAKNYHKIATSYRF